MIPETEEHTLACMHDSIGDRIAGWVRTLYPETALLVDIGAGWAKWPRLLPEYTHDAIDIHPPLAERFGSFYRDWHTGDAAEIMADIRPPEGRWDLAIASDVMEHMTVEQARRFLPLVGEACREFFIAVPWLHKQEAIQGNPYEAHQQEDLTPEVMEDRYGEWLTLVVNVGDKGVYRRRLS